MKKPQLTLDKRLAETVEAVRDRVDLGPRVGVVLGAEQEGFADRLRNAVKLPYPTLPHMPVPTSAGGGSLYVGFVDDVPVACLVGRCHLGQGFPPWQVVHGVRVLARLGVRTALVNEATGVLEPTMNVGDVMLVVDHVNLTTHDGLGKLSDDAFEMFPNMRTAYDPALNAELHEVVRTEKMLSARIGTSSAVDLVEGVYASIQDPSYETPAQMRMLRSFGAQAVGSSTALEITALRQLGVRTAALAHLAYRAAEGDQPSAEDEVTARGDNTHLQRLLRGWVVRAHRLGE